MTVEERRAEARRLRREEGLSVREIAERFDVSPGTIHRDLNRQAATRYREQTRRWKQGRPRPSHTGRVLSSAEATSIGARSAALRKERARQRSELRDLPGQEVARRLINPTPELASFRLRELFAPANTQLRPIRRFGTVGLDEVIRRLQRQGHEWPDREIRLRALSIHHRRALVREVLAVAPRHWSQGDDLAAAA